MAIALTDTISISDRKLTSDGYLAVSALAARTGIQNYLARELGDHFKDRDPNSIIRVYRPEEEVFKADSLASFAYRPVTNDHPSQSVTATNWRDLSAGVVGPDILRDKEGVRVNMLVMDAATIADIEAGKRGLSAGYVATIDATPGTAPDGASYDAVQRDIRINHVAVVANPRGGPALTISDHSPSESFALCDTIPNALPTKRKYMEHLVFDGLSVPLDDATAVKSLFDAMKGKMSKMEEEMDEKDKEMAAKDAAIADALSKIIDEATIDARAAEKAELLGKAKALCADADFAGKTAVEIKRAVVIAKRGAEMADKSEAYIDAAFDLLADEAPAKDAIADAVAANVKVDDAVAEAKAEYLKSHLKIGA